jgi:catechol 2,3-dioxygenase
METIATYVTPAPGYRLPFETRLGLVRLEVSDLARSFAYYRDVLGLRELSRSEGRVTLGTEDGATALLELTEVAGATPAPLKGRLGLYHFAILLPTRAALGRFTAHLMEIGANPGASDHGVSEALYLRDPDGLGIEVYADRPRSEWQTVGGALEMRLDPLDFADVIASAGGERWTGMPAGTTLGHMHLHVGDLTQGLRFYHHSLGFDVVAELPSAVFLSAGGYHHHLGTNTWAKGAEPSRPGDARLAEWTIVVPTNADAEAAARSLESAGHAVARDAAGWSATDPWNTRLRVVAA